MVDEIWCEGHLDGVMLCYVTVTVMLWCMRYGERRLDGVFGLFLQRLTVGTIRCYIFLCNVT
jgi:hypothetical protein